MKKAKKVVALALCAVMLVVGSVAGTMAYLNDTTDVVKNTFTVGKVQIDLDEAPVDIYGVVQDGERVKTNNYKLIPGHTYVKDPTVTVKADSEESYVRMIVTISDLADLKVACGVDVFLPQDFVSGWDNNTWRCVSALETNDDTGVYEFWYKDTVNTLDGNALVLDALFDEFTMPATATNDQILALEEVEINVIAHAIQADGFTDTVVNGTVTATAEENAWAAFDAE